MPTTTVIDGVSCEIDKLADGRIRVRHLSTQVNPMHGPGTSGIMEYLVHPCQRNQYHMLNGQFSEAERGVPQDGVTEPLPWWSLSAGERAGLRD